MPESRPPLTPIVVMGVSGCGKTTVGRLLADRLRGHFIDGDDLHTSAAVAKMASGSPLTDEDRSEWLARIGRKLSKHPSPSKPLVIACSALKRAYREQLRESCGELSFVHLHGSRALLESRLKARAAASDHFMPPRLLDSQLDTLEIPENEPRTWIVRIDADPETLSNQIAQLLSA